MEWLQVAWKCPTQKADGGNKNIFKNDWKLSKFRENYELTDLKISMDAKHKKHKETRKAHQS